MMRLPRCGTLQCTLHVAHGDALDQALRDAREAGVGTQVAATMNTFTIDMNHNHAAQTRARTLAPSPRHPGTPDPAQISHALRLCRRTPAERLDSATVKKVVPRGRGALRLAAVQGELTT